MNFAKQKDKYATDSKGKANDNSSSTNDRGGWKNDSKNDSWSKSSDWSKSKSDSGDSYSYNNRGAQGWCLDSPERAQAFIVASGALKLACRGRARSSGRRRRRRQSSSGMLVLDDPVVYTPGDV
ncbi:unnamed protein product [Prorocentrum cordatum]|uniref:Uncharacterized protein n=1 Tax=Prorocentrum cordatum TaxID=2364126 RepID=A0ABN9TY08_9DINO|nr:unnamed protein product [Polarella glacialis]